MASVCTEISALGESGLLNGKRATTHWRFAADVARRFPDIALEPDAIYIQDGNLYTSAGITAGIDLALGLVEADLGGRVALSVARDLVVYLKRSGGQMQFSEPLQFQARDGPFRRAGDMACRQLAQGRFRRIDGVSRAGLGVRHFSRRFAHVFGMPPAAYLEQLPTGRGAQTPQRAAPDCRQRCRLHRLRERRQLSPRVRTKVRRLLPASSRGRFADQ